ncbi:hypothetical protein ACJMK2_038317, partial [Sinanodonta woodiana]
MDRTWSGECVTCQKNTSDPSITCPAPCVPDGARMNGSHPYVIGSVVKFECLRFREDRSSIIKCIQNGEYPTWNGKMINCKDIICDKGDNYDFENGRVTYSSSVATIGTKASF